MQCTHCQREIAAESNFCYFCGAAQPMAGRAPRPVRRLMRSSTDVKLGGVCAGLAEYFECDPTLMRLGWVVLTLASCGFPGIIGYIVCWIVMPVAPRALPESTSSPTVDSARAV
jgi:phage shock protein C